MGEEDGMGVVWEGAAVRGRMMCRDGMWDEGGDGMACDLMC